MKREHHLQASGILSDVSFSHEASRGVREAVNSGCESSPVFTLGTSGLRAMTKIPLVGGWFGGFGI